MASGIPAINDDSLQKIAWKTLQFGDLIGEGSYGNVYKGSWYGKEVAIKKLHMKKLPEDLAEDFDNETKVMAMCQSSQIIKLFGVSLQSDQFAMVLEYMPKGSLYKLLNTKSETLGWEPTRMRIAADVSRGLAYLHDKGILHRDLKSLNVLVNQDYRAKITDFGLAKIKVATNSTSTLSKKSVGSFRWQPPELFKRSSRHTQASDVFSLGMVIWEIASGKLPYFEEVDEQKVISWIKEGEQENVPDSCPAKVSELIKRCWAAPEARPKAEEVAFALEQLLPKGKSSDERAWHIHLDRQVVIHDEPYLLLPASEKDMAKVQSFYSHHPVPGFEIGSVKVIYNPDLNRAFSLHLGKLQQRASNSAFAPKWSWELENSEWREKIHLMYEALAKPYRDPEYPAVKLLPLWHGTSPAIVDSICRTGYANLATTDGGFFGKGLYSAYEAEYANRVYSKGALILNWVASFSSYPVVDGDMQKLTGKANYQNYDSHFVPVSPKNPSDPNEANYYPCKPDTQHTYTEVVVFDSAACLPRYLVELQPIESKKGVQQSKSPQRSSKALPPTPPPKRPSTSKTATPATPPSPDHQTIFTALEKKDYGALFELLYATDPLLKEDNQLADGFLKEAWGKLELAIILGKLDMIQNLYKEDPTLISKEDVLKRSLLYIAAGYGGGHLPVLQWLAEKDRTLLQKTRNDGATCLAAASYRGYLPVVQWLVRGRAAVRSRRRRRGRRRRRDRLVWSWALQHLRRKPIRAIATRVQHPCRKGSWASAPRPRRGRGRSRASRPAARCPARRRGCGRSSPLRRAGGASEHLGPAVEVAGLGEVHAPARPAARRPSPSHSSASAATPASATSNTPSAWPVGDDRGQRRRHRLEHRADDAVVEHARCRARAAW